MSYKHLLTSVLCHMIIILLIIMPTYTLYHKAHNNIGNVTQAIPIKIIKAPYWLTASQNNTAGHKTKTSNPTKRLRGQRQQLAIFLHETLQSALNEVAKAADILPPHKQLMVAFSINSQGKLKDLKLLNTTGIAALDQAIVTSIENVNIPKALIPKRTERFNMRITIETD